MSRRPSLAFLMAAALGLTTPAAQTPPQTPPGAPAGMPLAGLSWRSIGPLRGGRSIAAAGVPSRPLEYYFGATGGGLWKTTDGAVTWTPVTDGQIRSSSVGAIAVSPSHPDVVYIGTGESQLRGNIMQGDGVYKSTDAGRTWRHSGLADTMTMARLRVHPQNPDVVFAAALGDPTTPGDARGVYRTTDGGATWRRVLFRDERTGAVDLVIDPGNPRIVYAALWQASRVAWQMSSGGPGSGLFKSTDGGDTWTELTRAPGFAAGVIGKIGIAVAGGDSNRLYAIVEAKAGGLYRSDDAGATWTLANASRDLWQRAFYFNRVTADPKDRDTVYILNFILMKSTDAGATYKPIVAPHVDAHDLWIDPANPRRMIESDDGGAIVTVNGGETWSSQAYPTAQLYRVETTTDVPYHVVACQQDNTSVAVVSRDGGNLPLPGARPGAFYYEVGGGESGWVAPHPAKPDIVFAGSTNALTRFDRRTGQIRDLQPWPRIVMGEPARDMPERWNWTYPVIFSPIAPHDLYVGSQHVWRSRDEGVTWEKISPDLTRADPATLGDSGGPIVLDQDGPEIYGTVFIIAPSRRERDTVWAGSDDGLLHVTRDGGKAWAKVTPPGVPPHSRISGIEPSPHQAARAYVAVKRNQSGDRQPYLFRTEDYGATWTRVDTGLERHDFTHAIREDPVRPRLLYAGTEHGVHVSFDDGAAWQSLRLNLPDVHVPDLKVERHDLVIATHGRSFYILDNLAPLRQWTSDMTAKRVHLFRPDGVYRGLAPALVDVWLSGEARGLKLDVLDAGGSVLRSVPVPASLAAGHHRIRWDLRTRGATVFPGMVTEAPNPARGVLVPPGTYTLRATLDGRPQTQAFEVHADPRVADVAADDLQAQFKLALRLRDATSAANEGVIRSRTLKTQLAQVPAAMRDEAVAIAATLTAVEADLYQIKNESPKDKIANPIRLNDRLAGLLDLVQSGDGRPTAAQEAVARQLIGELEETVLRLETIVRTEIAALNKKLAATGAKMIGTP